MFIDTGDFKIDGETLISSQRKNSFAFLDSSEGKSETPIDCLGTVSN